MFYIKQEFMESKKLSHCDEHKPTRNVLASSTITFARPMYFYIIIHISYIILLLLFIIKVHGTFCIISIIFDFAVVIAVQDCAVQARDKSQRRCIERGTHVRSRRRYNEPVQSDS